MQLAEMNWPAIAALDRETPVVFPIAALEQHGHHLPLFTDSYLLGEVVRRAAESLRDEVLFAPLMWLGNSDHHLEFKGTLSAPPRSYLDLLSGLLDNFIRHGFRRLVIVNGHGGNDVPGRQAIFEIRQKHRDRDDLLLLFATYWTLADPLKDSAAKFSQNQMGHACEWETSMILRLAPQLVGSYQSLKAIDAGDAFAPSARAWITRERTEPGHIGDPAAASAEKGEILLRAFAQGLGEFLRRVSRPDAKSWTAQ